MREHGGQSDQACIMVNSCCLHGCDFVPAQGLAHNIETACERGVAKGATVLTRKWRVNDCRSGPLWILKISLSFGQRRCDRSDRLTAALHGMPPFQRGQS